MYAIRSYYEQSIFNKEIISLIVNAEKEINSSGINARNNFV